MGILTLKKFSGAVFICKKLLKYLLSETVRGVCDITRSLLVLCMYRVTDSSQRSSSF